MKSGKTPFILLIVKIYNRDMVAYVEYVLLDNFIIDYLLVSASRKCLKLDENKRRLALSAFIGAITATLTPLLRLNAIGAILYKLFVSALVSAFSGRFGSIRNYARFLGCFCLISFACDGFIYSVLSAVGLTFDVLFFICGDELAFGLVILLTWVLYAILNKTFKALYKRKETANFYRDCVLLVGKEKFKVKGFVDTGNMLKFKGRSVVLCSGKTSKKLALSGALDGMFVDYLKVKTAAGETVVAIYKIDGIEIYNGGETNTISNVTIGLASGDFNGDGEFDVLLSAAFC